MAFRGRREGYARSGEPQKGSRWSAGRLPIRQEQAHFTRRIDAAPPDTVKSLPVFALPEVEADLRAAATHYASWRSDGAERIRQKYEETVDWIRWNPEAFPKKHGAVRRAILKQSYYIIYFLVEAERTVVLAVLDGRRNPQEIQSIVSRREGRTRRRNR